MPAKKIKNKFKEDVKYYFQRGDLIKIAEKCNKNRNTVWSVVEGRNKNPFIKKLLVSNLEKRKREYRNLKM